MQHLADRKLADSGCIWTIGRGPTDSLMPYPGWVPPHPSPHFQKARTHTCTIVTAPSPKIGRNRVLRNGHKQQNIRGGNGPRVVHPSHTLDSSCAACTSTSTLTDVVDVVGVNGESCQFGESDEHVFPQFLQNIVIVQPQFLQVSQTHKTSRLHHGNFVERQGQLVQRGQLSKHTRFQDLQVILVQIELLEVFQAVEGFSRHCVDAVVGKHHIIQHTQTHEGVWDKFGQQVSEETHILQAPHALEGSGFDGRDQIPGEAEKSAVFQVVQLPNSDVADVIVVQIESDHEVWDGRNLLQTKVRIVEPAVNGFVSCPASPETTQSHPA